MSLAFKGKLEIQTWDQVREQVAKVNPEFARIIDRLNPGKEYWLAKTTYPYGSLLLRRALLMLPNAKGDIVPLTDPSIDSKVREGLDYNGNSNPVACVLHNTFELFLPLEERTVPFQGLIYPGQVFGAWRMLNPGKTHQPIFIWDLTAGARSIFMLPKISEEKKHFKLRKLFDLSVNTPKSLMTHWEIFRQIANHPRFTQSWNAEILFFSKRWFDHLSDPDWREFYHYFDRSIWVNGEFLRNQPLWNLVFSIILNEYQGKPSAYIVDTVRYLINVAVGAQPAFVPARDNLSAPIAGLQYVYTNEYEIRNYPPIIMHPEIFDMYNPQGNPLYYSLQFPTAPGFTPHSRSRSSYVSDLHEIRSLLMRYQQEFISDRFNIGGTPYYDVFQLAKFDYFHNNVELHMGIRNSGEMPLEDKHLLSTVDGIVHKEFPDMCSFVKGCIRVGH